MATTTVVQKTVETIPAASAAADTGLYLSQGLLVALLIGILLVGVYLMWRDFTKKVEAADKANLDMLPAIQRLVNRPTPFANKQEALDAMNAVDAQLRGGAAALVGVLPTYNVFANSSLVSHIPLVVQEIQTAGNKGAIATQRANHLQALYNAVSAAYANLTGLTQEAIEAKATSATFTLDTVKAMEERMVAALKAVMATRGIEISTIDAIAALKAAKLSPVADLENGVLGNRVDELESILRKAVRLLDHGLVETEGFIEANRELGAVKDGILDASTNAPARKPVQRGGQQRNNNPRPPAAA